MKKRAFTLAEVMIVLVVIGILTAILMPIAFQSAPDENILKFKKSNSTFGTVVRELINSEAFASSNYVFDTGANFCTKFMDTVTIRSGNCSSLSTTACGHADFVTADGVTWSIQGGSFGDTRTICFDVDAWGSGQAPFQYTLRKDGKITPSATANEWMQKSLQKTDN